MASRAPLAPMRGGGDDNTHDRRLRSLFTPWKGAGEVAGTATATPAPTPTPTSTPVVLRSWSPASHHRHRRHARPQPQQPLLTLTLEQQHTLAGGRGRALAFDTASAALYAGDGLASLKKLSLLSPNAPLAMRLPAHSRGARAVAPPAHPAGCGHLAGVATAGAGLVMVSSQTGNTVASVPFLGGQGSDGGLGGLGGPTPGASAGAWSVAWSPLRPTHELLVGLDGGRVATVDLRCAASSLSGSGSSSAGRAVLSVVRMGEGGGGNNGAASCSVVGPPVHTLVPLPAGCEAALVGGEALAASAAGVFALWRPPGLPSRAMAAPRLATPPLPPGASCESASVSGDGKAVAVSVRRRPGSSDNGGGGAEVWVFRLAGDGEEEDDEEEEQRGARTGPASAPIPLRLGGHVSAAHLTAGALLSFSDGDDGLVYASGDEARRAPVAWRLLEGPSSGGAAGVASPLSPPSLAAPLPAPLPSPVLAVAGAHVPGLLGSSSSGSGGGGAPPTMLLAAASAGCVRVYQVGLGGI